MIDHILSAFAGSGTSFTTKLKKRKMTPQGKGRKYASQSRIRSRFLPCFLQTIAADSPTSCPYLIIFPESCAFH